ncbi:hypothetical protein [Streptosporangium lutulentum]|uniref:Uncharacterized protein n=1 Tax=Streptosporangium lutulentum TaxID=1461250 RepID=A0ABT9QQZ8_9ACTN|nr:hypothetical protein [Streptosporangium lutulentum]MDP9848434.1 hypothetical protein [Streptosporangium lutulentum]
MTNLARSLYLVVNSQPEDPVGVGVSIFFLTLGAILRFAIEPDVLGENVHIDVIGLIFMIVGAVGVVLSIVMAPKRGQVSDDRLIHRENNPPEV